MAFSEKQEQIFDFAFSDKKAIICDGAVRSGKTMCMGFAFVLFAFDRFNHTNFGICGKTVGSCEKNVVKPLLSLSYMREHFQMKYTRSDHCLTITRGSKTNYFYIYGGKDESSYMLIQGITLGGVLLDEVALMTRSFVEQALARCSLTGSKLWFNCNPENPSHWFYQEWILNAEEKKAVHLHFLMTDNPSLSEEIINDYETRYKGTFYRRYVLGEWVRAEGLVYPMFDPEKHIIDDHQKGGRYFISCDYGTLNPCVFLLWRVNLYSQDFPIVLVSEYYHSGRGEEGQKTDNEYYDDLEMFAEGYYIEKVIVDPSAASFKALIRQKGKFMVRDAVNDVLDGLRYTGALIADNKIGFDRSCVNTFAEFGAYVWDEDATEDRVIKDNDHCLTGDTIIHTAYGDIPIKQLAGYTGYVSSYNTKTGKAEEKRFTDVRCTRKNAPIVKIKLKDGGVIRCTDDHLILTDKGYIEAGKLTKQHRIIKIDASITKLVEIESVEQDGIEDVYNMEVEDNHNFAVNGGYIVHNCMDAMRYMMYTIIRREMRVEAGGSQGERYIDEYDDE